MSKPKILWTAEQTAELIRLVEAGVKCRGAAVALNFKFGTSRTRKSCACHLYDMGNRSVRGKHKPWMPEHDAALRALQSSGFPFSQIAAEINRQFGTAYTRNACIGRARRIDANPHAAQRVYVPKEVQAAAASKRKREKRWAADPSLQVRYERLQEMKKNRETQIKRGATKTSANYRRHIPRAAEMTRGELRAMLSQAVRNTAAMEIAV